MYINNCACNFDKLYGLSICYLLIIRYTLALHYVLLIEKDPKKSFSAIEAIEITNSFCVKCNLYQRKLQKYGNM